MRLNDAKFADNGGCGYVLKPPPLRRDALLAASNGAADSASDFAADTTADDAAASAGGSNAPRSRELSVRVLSARRLPPPPGARDAAAAAGGGGGGALDPYVVVTVHGATRGGCATPPPRRTRAANDNGFTPVWADEEACFSFVVEDDALAFVEFEVYDRADVLERAAGALASVASVTGVTAADGTRAVGGDRWVCGAVVPTSALREGFRAIVLGGHGAGGAGSAGARAAADAGGAALLCYFQWNDHIATNGGVGSGEEGSGLLGPIFGAILGPAAADLSAGSSPRPSGTYEAAMAKLSATAEV